MKMHKMKYVMMVAAAMVLAGCSMGGNKKLYYWGDNSETVYQHMKSDGEPLGKQIDEMTKYFKKAQSKKQNVAPGAHAHMGLLMIDSGNTDEAIEHFEQEKQLFPESGVFMDFLLKNARGGQL
ncbi:DUF4810 domain-containing protein [Neisseria montereyensis]|uniref:DUF4810 domain-containing protein n=1 Tax=Neisseria montereyensis TaxID=2973938 RepID=A0ABT2FFI2_9NEIS|nr:DUF4810 domain-containing protein [Neisseria montereyensis]MCS4534680.1 DUF4810 domain-containing protein [Neisseria montereyensis]